MTVLLVVFFLFIHCLKGWYERKLRHFYSYRTTLSLFLSLLNRSEPGAKRSSSQSGGGGGIERAGTNVLGTFWCVDCDGQWEVLAASGPAASVARGTRQPLLLTVCPCCCCCPSSSLYLFLSLPAYASVPLTPPPLMLLPFFLSTSAFFSTPSLSATSFLSTAVHSSPFFLSQFFPLFLLLFLSPCCPSLCLSLLLSATPVSLGTLSTVPSNSLLHTAHASASTVA